MPSIVFPSFPAVMLPGFAWIRSYASRKNAGWAGNLLPLENESATNRGLYTSLTGYPDSKACRSGVGENTLSTFDTACVGAMREADPAKNSQKPVNAKAFTSFFAFLGYRARQWDARQKRKAWCTCVYKIGKKRCKNKVRCLCN